MRTTATVHNPMLKLRTARLIQTLPPEARDALKAVLLDFRAECRAKGDAEWKRNKFWNAAYYKVLAVYAVHISRLCRDPQPEVSLLQAAE